MQLSFGQTIRIFLKSLPSLVYQEDVGGSLLPLDMKAEFLDGIEHRRALFARVALLLRNPFQSEVIDLRETRLVDHGSLAKVSGRQRLKLLRQLRGRHVLADRGRDAVRGRTCCGCIRMSADRLRAEVLA